MALPECFANQCSCGDNITVAVAYRFPQGRCRNVATVLVRGKCDLLATLVCQAQINNISIGSESRFKQFPCSVKEQ